MKVSFFFNLVVVYTWIRKRSMMNDANMCAIWNDARAGLLKKHYESVKCYSHRVIIMMLLRIHIKNCSLFSIMDYILYICNFLASIYIKPSSCKRTKSI